MSDMPPKKSQRRYRWLKWLVAVVLLLGVCGELVARFYLGLGDPPLSMADPEIEYLFKPNQDVNRFGNRVKYNAYSMRSDDFPKDKTDEQEVRVLVLGDSVVNGGNLTAQHELATEIVKGRLAAELGKPVVVGNISTGSWGPGNQLAYLKRYGLFDADVVVLVISSHDASDVPTFEPIVGTSAFPEHKPVLALQEAIFRYLPRYLPGNKPPEEPPYDEPEVFAFDAEGALSELIVLIQEAGVPMVILQHATRDELGEGYDPGHDAIGELARRMGVPTIDLAGSFQSAMDAGQSVYRDNIHPNTQGQRVIAEVLGEAITERLKLDKVGTE